MPIQLKQIKFVLFIRFISIFTHNSADRDFSLDLLVKSTFRVYLVI